MIELGGLIGCATSTALVLRNGGGDEGRLRKPAGRPLYFSLDDEASALEYAKRKLLPGAVKGAPTSREGHINDAARLGPFII